MQAVTAVLDSGATPPGRRVSPIEVLRSLGVSLGGPAEEGAPRAPTLSLGRFQLLGELGRGGMGRVMDAMDPDLHRPVAIKLILDPSRVTERMLARFVGEAQVTAQLAHAHIVPVHEMGVTPQGEVYFVMRRIEGRTLRAALKSWADPAGPEDPWSLRRRLGVFLPVCNAVAFAHSRGVLHRDLKPDNVMLGPFGEVFVLDWGISRLVESAQEDDLTWDEVHDSGGDTPSVERVGVPTLDGTQLGTPGYMSPEQAAGELTKIDERSDVYSLGALLYELLTLRRAYEGDHVLAILFAMVSGQLVAPRARAPDAGIPEDLEAICLRAMATDPAARFQSVRALADAVEASLDGAGRRERAGVALLDAELAKQRWRGLLSERARLEERQAALEQQVHPWDRLDEPLKAELVAVRGRLAALEPERAAAFGELVAGCERSMAQDPGHPAARRLLADAYRERFDEAEAEGRDADVRYFAELLRAADDGRHAAWLEGSGSLTLDCDPPAEVLVQRFDTSGLLWKPGSARSLGRTPLVDVPLRMGRYLLTLRAADHTPTRYPVHIPRGHRWEGGVVRLPPSGAVPPGWAFVPGGPCIIGGADPGLQDPLPPAVEWVEPFLIAIHSFAMGDYCRFLDALDPDEAWARVPRNETTRGSPGSSYFARPAPGEGFQVPAEDADGDAWSVDWPVFAVSWDDAVACAGWRARIEGLPIRLPTEREWEKAARSVDGRAYPWGDGWDASLCRLRDSLPGRPNPAPIASFPTDLSVYGVRGMAGNVRDWCGDPTYGDHTDKRPTRGGSFNSLARTARCASRFGFDHWNTHPSFGFRLAMDPTW